MQAISWLPVGAGILAAVIALDARLGDAAIEAPATAEYRALVLIVLLLAPLITFEAWRFRRWEPGVAALLILFACVAALWPVFDWPTWTLAATYAVAGAGGFVALTRWRRVADDSAALAVQALSWLPLAAAMLAAAAALEGRLAGGAIEAPATAEYRTLVLVVLLLAPLITFEAWRFRRWEPGVAALLILLACVAALWPVFDWPTWTLAATYAVAGAGGFVALTRWRRVAADSGALAVQALSWLPGRRGHPRRPHRPRRPPHQERGDRGARHRRVPRAGADRAAIGAADHLRGVALPPLGAGSRRAADPARLRGRALAGLRLAGVDTCRHLRSRRRGRLRRAYPLAPRRWRLSRACRAGALMAARRRGHPRRPHRPRYLVSRTGRSRRRAPPSTGCSCWSCCCWRRSSPSRRGASAVGSRAWPRC